MVLCECHVPAHFAKEQSGLASRSLRDSELLDNGNNLINSVNARIDRRFHWWSSSTKGGQRRGKFAEKPTDKARSKEMDIRNMSA
jgi:hypothetical protein